MAVGVQKGGEQSPALQIEFPGAVGLGLQRIQRAHGRDASVLHQKGFGIAGVLQGQNGAAEEQRFQGTISFQSVPCFLSIAYHKTETGYTRFPA